MSRHENPCAIDGYLRHGYSITYHAFCGVWLVIYAPGSCIFHMIHRINVQWSERVTKHDKAYQLDHNANLKTNCMNTGACWLKNKTHSTVDNIEGLVLERLANALELFFLALTRRYKQHVLHAYTTCTSPVSEIHVICHSFSTWAQCPQIWPIALATVFVSIASLVIHRRHHCRLTQPFTFKSGTHLPINLLLLAKIS